MVLVRIWWSEPGLNSVQTWFESDPNLIRIWLFLQIGGRHKLREPSSFPLSYHFLFYSVMKALKLFSVTYVNPPGTHPLKPAFWKSVLGFRRIVLHLIKKEGRLISNLEIQAITGLFLGTQDCVWALVWKRWNYCGFSRQIGCESLIICRTEPIGIGPGNRCMDLSNDTPLVLNFREAEMELASQKG